MSAAALRPFHLAIVVDDLKAAGSFYGGVLGCAEGRSTSQWADFDFFGHQLVCHLGGGSARVKAAHRSSVDGHDVPVPHFGLVLEPGAFNRTRDRLVAAGTEFIIQPHVRFAGEPGEQSTMFLCDPAGNNIEFKSFADFSQMFAR